MTVAETTSLVDWAPTLRLVALALLIAALPLGVVWVRARGADAQARMTALTAMTLFLTFDLVVFGSFTRLTDSGLGCPDWPGCYGQASPLGAHRDIQAAQAAMPHGPVTVSKAWIEMIHRYLAMMVGVLIRRHRRRRRAARMAAGGGPPAGPDGPDGAPDPEAEQDPDAVRPTEAAGVHAG